MIDNPIIEAIVSFLILAGSIFVLIAGLGTLRFPDIYCRIHPASKAVMLGLALPMIALFLVFPTMTTIVKMFFTVLFIVLTTPVAAHLIARAAYREGIPACDENVVDEYNGQHLPTARKSEAG